MIDEFGLYPREDPFDPFSVMLFKALQVVSFLFFLALLAISPEAKDGKIDSKAEFIVTMDWPDSDADVAFTWYRHDIFCPATIPFGMLMFVVTDVGCDGELHVLSLNGPLTRLHK